jgi:hypothetical protein
VEVEEEEDREKTSAMFAFDVKRQERPLRMEQFFIQSLVLHVSSFSYYLG